MSTKQQPAKRGRKRKQNPSTQTFTKLTLFEKHEREFERCVERLMRVDVRGYLWMEDAVAEAESLSEEVVDSPNDNPIIGIENDSTTENVSKREENETFELSMGVGRRRKSQKKLCKESADDGMSTAAQQEDSSQEEEEDNDSVYENPSNFPIIEYPRSWFEIQHNIHLKKYARDNQEKEYERYNRLLNLLQRRQPPIEKADVEATVDALLDPVPHPDGIDWEGFKVDVQYMCRYSLNRLEKLKESQMMTLNNCDPSNDARVLKWDTLSADDLEKFQSLLNRMNTELNNIFSRTGMKQLKEIQYSEDRLRYQHLCTDNNDAAMQGQWKKQPEPERKYKKIFDQNSTLCDGLSPIDQLFARHEMSTHLQPGIYSIPYTFDDSKIREDWMNNVLNQKFVRRKLRDDETAETRERAKLVEEKEVIRAQVAVVVDSLVMSVQDRCLESLLSKKKELRVDTWLQHSQNNNTLNSKDANLSINETDMTENETNVCSEIGCSGKFEFDLGASDISEQPVWGIDKFTRENIRRSLGYEFADVAAEFIDEWLLPAINACDVKNAHNIESVVKMLLKDEAVSRCSTPSGETGGLLKETLSGYLFKNVSMKNVPSFVKPAAMRILSAHKVFEGSAFRIHPKGTGCVVVRPGGLPPHTLVTHYRGEVYPSWRWGEKLDAIEDAQNFYGIKPFLPDFYNMCLERPSVDARGYGLLFVDASKKAGWGSSMSHSCNPTCEVKVASRNNRLALIITTVKHIRQGEELTFDYNAVTESLEEYMQAVCLCGHANCRGSFLHFATADCYQKVLNKNSPIGVRFKHLVEASKRNGVSKTDENMLSKHGFGAAAFGELTSRINLSTEVRISESMKLVPPWLQFYVAETLRYIEFERRSLPTSLFGTNKKKPGRKPGNGSFNGYFSFASANAKKFMEELKSQGYNDVTLRDTKKIASEAWAKLSDQEREKWRIECIESKAERKKNAVKEDKTKKIESKTASLETDAQWSYAGADGDGRMAMEQRVQCLTQSLSRVGRVLSRHRFQRFEIDPPVKQAEASYVVEKLWCDVVLKVVEFLQKEVVMDSSVTNKLNVILLKVSSNGKLLPSITLNEMQAILLSLRKLILESISYRYRVTECKNTASTSVEEKLECSLPSSKSQADTSFNLGAFTNEPISAINDGFANSSTSMLPVTSSSNNSVLGVSPPMVTPPADHQPSLVFINDERMIKSVMGDEEVIEPIVPEGKRHCLEAMTDLLLLYAKTKRFYTPKSYCPLISAPINVYAKELGNQVAKSSLLKNHRAAVVEVERGSLRTISLPEVSVVDQESYAGHTTSDATSSISEDESLPKKGAVESKTDLRQRLKAKASNSQREEYFDATDTVASVSRHYSEDYVLSQLLLWFTGGISTKPGVPDILGCIMIPSIDSCSTDKSKIFPKTVDDPFDSYQKRYNEQIRPKLLQSMSTKFTRGVAWTDKLASYFDCPFKTYDGLLFGSPLLDSIMNNTAATVEEISKDIKDLMKQRKLEVDFLKNLDTAKEKLLRKKEKEEQKKAKKAQQTVNPPVLVEQVNWVQCENPACEKWRRLPLEVDLSTLPEKFYCEYNIWNPERASCNAPEDTLEEIEVHITTGTS